jgi:hypothetical protein
MPEIVVRIRRADVPGARVEDGVIGALSARLQGGLPQPAEDGAVYLTFAGTEADALATVQRAMESIPDDTLARYAVELADP